MVNQSNDHPPTYRKPALKRNWVISGNDDSLVFAPLTPGLRTLALHHVSPPQRRLLALLQGKKTTEEIQQQLISEFPALSVQTVSAMLAQLDRVGVLEEADLLPPADWTRAYIERYTRDIAFFAGYERPDLSRFEQQRRIRDAHIVLLGAGGIGSWIAMLLGQLGIGHLTIADDDEVSSSNLTRHALFTEKDIGKNKAAAAAEALHALNGAIEITVIPHLIETEEALHAISQNAQLVIVSFGPFFHPVPMRLHQACFRLGLPSIALNGLHIGPLVIPGQTFCFSCAQSFFAQQTPWQVGKLGEEVNNVLHRGYYAIFAPLVAACTGLGVMEIAKYIAGFAPSYTTNGIIYLNPTDLSIHQIPIPRDPACHVCGTGSI